MEQRRQEIKIEGTPKEKELADAHKEIKLSEEITLVRNFLIEYYLFFHQGILTEEEMYGDQYPSKDFLCPACQLFTFYSHAPHPSYPAPLCLSSVCVGKHAPFREQYIDSDSDEEIEVIKSPDQ